MTENNTNTEGLNTSVTSDGKRIRLIPYTDPRFRWSFSSISSYVGCPYQFKLNYIDGVEGGGNAFSDYGTLVHHVLEKWALGELMDFELGDYYLTAYDKGMKHDYPPFPKNMAEKAFEQGVEYFQSFTGFGDDYEIVGVEQKYQTEINGRIFGGIIDLILKNKETGKYVVIDHKTKSPASMNKEMGHYRHQLYLYAKYIHDVYGEYPEAIMFNMTKGKNMIVEEFDEAKYNETIKWATEIIEKILADNTWEIGGNSYFCQNICSFRRVCEYSDRFRIEAEIKKRLREGGLVQ